MPKKLLRKALQPVRMQVGKDVVELGQYDEKHNTLIVKRSQEDLVDGCLELVQPLILICMQKHMKIKTTLKENKWVYTITADDFKYHGLTDEKTKAVRCSLEHFTVERASRLSHVVSCDSTKCKHNFYKQCSAGTISVKRGGCATYEEDGARK